MSWIPCKESEANEKAKSGAVDLVIVPRTGDIGNFQVRRALPFKKRRMVGPFIFWDQMGPGELLRGQGIDVRPHPHIGLSTVTYLFEGQINHKDSLGTNMLIQPGDLNLMTAGKGIVHSERTAEEDRAHKNSLFGIQSWIAQPRTKEDSLPSFKHVKAHELPVITDKGISLKLLLGSAFGAKVSIPLEWETLYVELRLQKNASLLISKETEERALYGLTGKISLDGLSFDPQQMIVLKPGIDVKITAEQDAHWVLLGGATLDGPRYVWWNFVSSSKEKLELAARDWKNGKFPLVPLDEKDFIPLPDMPFPK